jgi:hypothetical protein
MMSGFKLTDQNGQTRGATQWGAGITHSIPVDKRKNEHCSDGVLHFYESLDLGLLMNPCHGNYFDPQIWTCETPERIGTDGLKSWCYELQTLERVDIPSWYQNQTLRLQVIVSFARLCADAARYASDASDAAEAVSTARYASYAASDAASDAARYARYARTAASYAVSCARTARDAAEAVSTARYASYAASDAASDAASYARDAASYAVSCARYARYAAEAVSTARYAIDFVGLVQKSVAWVMKYQGGA